jgi:molybdopterin converting factor small subunit
MQVRVKLHASLRRYVPANATEEPFPVELPSGATVADLVACLGIPENHAKLCVVDGEQGGMERVLHEGAVVALFPPLAGG